MPRRDEGAADYASAYPAAAAAAAAREGKLLLDADAVPSVSTLLCSLMLLLLLWWLQRWGRLLWC